MKIITSLLLMLIVNLTPFAGSGDPSNPTFAVTFVDNSIHSVFYKRVNIRDGSNLNSKVIGKAIIGEKIKIIMNTKKSETLYGITAYWYKIEFKGKTGYLWGGLLSYQETEADFNNNGRKEIVLDRALTYTHAGYNEYLMTYKHEYKLCYEGELINDNLFMTKPLDSNAELVVLENLGFKPSCPLLKVAWRFGDGPGWSSKYELFYLKDNQFNLLYKFEDFGVELDSEKHILVFPQKHGEKNTLIIKKHSIKYKCDDEVKRTLEHDTKTIVAKFKWDGRTFKPF